ncbi:MAG: hypothetical protein KatS3mg109_0538 [Pirellulaceae bacterium]|nr:MAG: hypothetical protein KatS3mg109_0538 [Pirellulaceae bacterium]
MVKRFVIGLCLLGLIYLAACWGVAQEEARVTDRRPAEPVTRWPWPVTNPKAARRGRHPVPVLPPCGAAKGSGSKVAGDLSGAASVLVFRTYRVRRLFGC